MESSCSKSDKYYENLNQKNQESNIQQSLKQEAQLSGNQQTENNLKGIKMNTLVMKSQEYQFVKYQFQPQEQLSQLQELANNDIVAVHLKGFLLEDQRNEIEKQFDIFRQNINDFRDAKLLQRGDGRIQDIIDPSLNIPKYH